MEHTGGRVKSKCLITKQWSYTSNQSVWLNNPRKGQTKRLSAKKKAKVKKKKYYKHKAIKYIRKNRRTRGITA